MYEMEGNELVRQCGKFAVLDRMLVKLHASGHRVLLFSTMTRLLDLLGHYLRWRRIGTEQRQMGFLRTNAEMEGEVLEQMAAPDEAGRRLLTDAAERMQLTARGYHRVLKVARTIADLAGAQGVAKAHVAEALAYRRMAHL